MNCRILANIALNPAKTMQTRFAGFPGLPAAIPWGTPCKDNANPLRGAFYFQPILIKASFERTG
ncbi:MAG: hypothetical protein MUD02_10790 [Bacteroidales bacterium]|nr:hypothetical protein [Bacteroidales bacterium]MCU0409423.1 hypothetical protein [Bacteroidales bacterium]